MRKQIAICMLVIESFISGCTPIKTLRPGAETVRVVKGDAPSDLVYVGEVSGQDGSGCGVWGYKGTYERAVIDLRNKAIAMDANFVQIMGMDTPNREYRCYDNTYRIDGTAYRTKQADGENWAGSSKN